MDVVEATNVSHPGRADGRLIRRLVFPVVSVMLMATACAPGGQGPGPIQETATTGSPSDGASPKPPDAASSPEVPGFTIPEAVDCGELPREPTEIEAGLLVQPGPFSGDDFDVDAALAAVVAQEPSSHDEWVEAIIQQVQGDYAQAMCDAIRFSAGVGDAEDRPTSSEPPDAQPGTGNHFALVLDASGSMAEKTGGGTRMDAAQTAMTRFVASLPDGSSISLRVYGQEGSNSTAEKDVSCASSEVLFKGVAGDSSFGAIIDAVEPVGWTPLARAISLVAEDIPTDVATAIVYVVTDGEETCNGDPVEAARQLAADGIEPIINVIGFEADNADRAALRRVAQAGNGQYVTASSLSELEAFWSEEYERLNQAWADWAGAEKERVASVQDKLQLEVEGIVATIRTTAETDLPHAQSLARRLETDGFLEGDAGQSVTRSLTYYFSDVTTLAGLFELDSLSAIRTSGFDATFGAAGESYDAWREAYERRMAEDE